MVSLEEKLNNQNINALEEALKQLSIQKVTIWNFLTVIRYLIGVMLIFGYCLKEIIIIQKNINKVLQSFHVNNELVQQQIQSINKKLEDKEK